MVFFSEIIIVVFLGLVLGSFTTALVYRVPLGVSWGAKRSSCPSCNTVLGFFDLIPFLSWCCSKGKCRYCANKISIIYPLIELSCLGLCLGVYFAYGLGVGGLIIFAAIPFLLALLIIDIKHMILPNQLVFALFLIGLFRLMFFWYLNQFSYESGISIGINYLIAAIVFAGLSWLTGAVVGKLIKKESLGFGDVKFFGVAGLWLGLDALPLFMIISGGLAVVMALVWRYIKKSEVFPFGPALITSFFIILLYQGILFT